MVKERIVDSDGVKDIDSRINRLDEDDFVQSQDGHESVFYVPPHEKNPDYEYHWAREFVDGQLDEKELHKYIVRYGWQFASISDHPSFNFKGLKENTDGKVRIPGHVLLKCPKSRVNARKEASRQHRMEQMQSVAEYASGGDLNMYQEANETSVSKTVKAKGFQ